MRTPMVADGAGRVQGFLVVCRAGEEGRPLGDAVQADDSSNALLLRPRVVMLNVLGKGLAERRGVDGERIA